MAMRMTSALLAMAASTPFLSGSADTTPQSILIGISFTAGATPSVACGFGPGMVPACDRPATMPASWVPWPFLSSVSFGVLPHVAVPGTTVGRSSWPLSTPVPTIATVAPVPVPKVFCAVGTSTRPFHQNGLSSVSRDVQLRGDASFGAGLGTHRGHRAHAPRTRTVAASARTRTQCRVISQLPCCARRAALSKRLDDGGFDLFARRLRCDDGEQIVIDELVGAVCHDDRDDLERQRGATLPVRLQRDIGDDLEPRAHR